MLQIRLPQVPSNELAPRMRLAQKLQAAKREQNRNVKKGELYEVAVGISLQNWLTGGFQIGRSKLYKGESDQKVYVGRVEVDGLFRKRLDRRWIINQAKSSSGEGGAQIRESMQLALLDQVLASREGKRGQIAGLIYAEPTGIEQAQRKLVENVAKLIQEREVSVLTTYTRYDFAEALDINSQKLRISVKEAEQRLNNIAKHHKDFPVAEYRRQVLSEVESLLGISFIAISPQILPEDHLQRILQPEIQQLDQTAQNIPPKPSEQSRNASEAPVAAAEPPPE